MTLAMPEPPRRPPFPSRPPDTVRPRGTVSADAKDPRRQTGRRVEPTAIVPRTASRPQIAAYRPPPIEAHDDDDAFRRRVLSEVNDRLAGMADGLAEHVRVVVRSELEPYIGQLRKLDDVVAMLEEDREERAEYRANREVRERIEKEQREADMHRLAMQRGQVEIQRMNVDVQQAPVESSRKYKLALLGVVVTALGIIAGLIGAAIGSQRRGP